MFKSAGIHGVILVDDDAFDRHVVCTVQTLYTNIKSKRLRIVNNNRQGEATCIAGSAPAPLSLYLDTRRLGHDTIQQGR